MSLATVHTTTSERDAEVALMLARIAEEPYRYDLWQLLRWLDAKHPDAPPLGRAPVPELEPLRIGQEPSPVFAPAQVFLLYGVTGTLAEALSVRLDSLLAGYWIFVYGLFVWLPAEAMRRPPDLCPPRLRHGVAAVVLPFVAAIPVAFVAIGVDRALGLEHVAMHAAAGAPPAR